MEPFSLRRSPYSLFVLTGLTLFGLSLALSKSAQNVIIALLYLAALAQVLLSRERRSVLVAHLRQPLLLPLALYIGVALLGVIYSERVADGLGNVNKMVGMALIYFMTAVLLDAFGKERSRPAAEGMLLAFIAGVVALDIIGLLTYLGVIGDKKYVLPVWPLHVHHIWYANINAVGVYAAALLLLQSHVRADARKRYPLLAFLPLAAVSLLLSLSRTAWFGMLVTIVAVSAVLVRDRKRLLLVLVILALAGGAIYGTSPIVRNRIDLIFSEISLFFSGKAETNVGERFLLWKAAFKMFLSHPIFGIGTGDYVATMNRYMSSGEFPSYLHYFNQPHNMYLFALATNGLIGLGVLLFLFFRALSHSVRMLQATGQERFFGLLGLAVLVHYLVGGMTDSFLNIQMLRYTFAFVMGMCIRTSLRREVPVVRQGEGMGDPSEQSGE